MKSFQNLAPFFMTLLLAGLGANAQQVYRCGSSYGQSRCPDGVAVPADDPRTDAQRAAAKQALSQDKALAKQLEASRHKEEAQALALDRAALARAKAAHNKPDTAKPVAAKPHKKPAKTRSAKVPEPDVFTATVGKPATKKKAKKPTGTKP
jgi:hypothetical protein